MITFLEKPVAAIWNRIPRRGRGAWRNEGGELDLGYRVLDEEVSRRHVRVSNVRRTMHLAVLGKTGSGKSSLLKYLAAQDIEAGRGFAYFDVHGDTTPFLLRLINDCIATRCAVRSSRHADGASLNPPAGTKNAGGLPPCVPPCQSEQATTS